MGEKKKEVEINQDRTDEMIRTGKEALDKAGKNHSSGTVYSMGMRNLYYYKTN